MLDFCVSDISLREHDINQNNNFIAGWYLDNNFSCDEIIKFHESKPRVPGTVSSGNVDISVKKSFDVALDEQDLLKKYVSKLQLCCDLYVKKYAACNQFAPWRLIDWPNIQKYDPDGGFYSWHCERVNNKEPFSSRHLVYMTYLNDVQDQGETEFLHQKVKIKPEKGLTLIWPADWTFTHRGISSPSQTKYIVTGWFNFVDEGN